MSTVKTMPHATPVTMTTTEEEGEANIDPDSDLEPVTAFESVTPEEQGSVTSVGYITKFTSKFMPKEKISTEFHISSSGEFFRTLFRELPLVGC